MAHLLRKSERISEILLAIDRAARAQQEIHLLIEIRQRAASHGYTLTMDDVGLDSILYGIDVQLERSIDDCAHAVFTMGRGMVLSGLA